jgi:hypothetical protein
MSCSTGCQPGLYNGSFSVGLSLFRYSEPQLRLYEGSARPGNRLFDDKLHNNYTEGPMKTKLYRPSQPARPFEGFTTKEYMPSQKQDFDIMIAEKQQDKQIILPYCSVFQQKIDTSLEERANQLMELIEQEKQNEPIHNASKVID